MSLKPKLFAVLTWRRLCRSLSASLQAAATMVRVSVLNDALKSMYNAEKRGKRQVMIRPSSKVIIKFLMVMQKHGYIGEFEFVDDHRSGKIVVELNGRLNKCGVISPRFDVGVKEMETWTARLLPSRQVICKWDASGSCNRMLFLDISCSQLLLELWTMRRLEGRMLVAKCLVSSTELGVYFVGRVEVLDLILESACRCFALRALVCIIQESIAYPPSCHSGSALFIQVSTFPCELVVHQHSWPLSVVESGFERFSGIVRYFRQRQVSFWITIPEQHQDMVKPAASIAALTATTSLETHVKGL
ncbi:hypothetical protein POTOM_031084 [Populus tomentosa]|uniref:40S ribosomal protein S15a n=1 Tax=Populus tomentosa TaxID=118781 RepID=A0A8X7ZC10_POPTO|nr:hypothetical protein POTOM_031084 [Populus tomentosa]